MKAPLATLFLISLGLVAAQPNGPKELRNPPYAIGHRGLAGVYPEHTIKGYQAAIDSGADFFECDVVPTKDCQLVCRHEPDLSGTTDALEKFPQLKKNVTIDGAVVEGVFSFDLTLQQIKTLRAIQRVPIRDQSYNGLYEIPTMEEYLQLAQSAPRVVGVYPETKHPSFHDSLELACFGNRTFTDAVVDMLTEYGYTGAIGTKEWLQKPAFLQSFERNNLIEAETDLPKIFLTDEVDLVVPYENGVTYGSILASDTELKALHDAGIRGIGPWKNTLIATTEDNHLNTSTIPDGKKLMDRLHSLGFEVHIYTLRNEAIRPDGSGFLPWDYKEDPYYEYVQFFDGLGVDGAFTDQVHSLARYLGKNNETMFMAKA